MDSRPFTERIAAAPEGATLAQETMPARPALRYFGAKFQLAPWVISHFPSHVCYCEPFAGAAGVLLRKERSRIEVLNDLNGDIINFFDVLRNRTDELVRAVELTPYAREEYRRAQEPCEDPLERARRFYVWAQQGRGRAGVVEPGGWRFMSRDTRGTTPADDFASVEHLYDVARRLTRVHIESADAALCVKRFDTPETLFYVDPPYVAETRGGRWSGSAYRFELTDADHRALAEVLHAVKGMVVLSGYPSELYDVELYAGWHRVEREALADGTERRTEVLWINDATRRARDNDRPLFNVAEVA